MLLPCTSFVSPEPVRSLILSLSIQRFPECDALWNCSQRPSWPYPWTYALWDHGSGQRPLLGFGRSSVCKDCIRAQDGSRGCCLNGGSPQRSVVFVDLAPSCQAACLPITLVKPEALPGHTWPTFITPPPYTGHPALLESLHDICHLQDIDKNTSIPL